MFPLHCSISSVSRFSVLDIRFVVSIDTLQDPSIVIILSYFLEVATDRVRADNSNCEHVAVVHKQEASSEVGPGKRHFYN